MRCRACGDSGCPAPCKPGRGEPVPVNPGRKVLVFQALGALLPPIAGFILGYALARPLAGGESAGEGLRALAGLAGMFLLGVCRVSRVKPQVIEDDKSPNGYHL
ncbi:MAG: SoxR reducing system RseC family protein [Treponema sp.]|jgi:hypothetical protein|nr:SoxR reducing system RseC family protein [Treponema sp.]